MRYGEKYIKSLLRLQYFVRMISVYTFKKRKRDRCSAEKRLIADQLVGQNPSQTMQHANATCRNIVGSNMLRAFGHRVTMCCDTLGVVGSNLKMVKFEPTTPNMSQHDGQTHATCCAQQCCLAKCCVGMLRSFGRGLTFFERYLYLTVILQSSPLSKVQRRPDFSNSRVFKPPHNLSQKSFTTS